MSATIGPNLGLSHSWAEGESGWKPGMDANLKLLDTIAMGMVVDKDLTAPPGGPTHGDRYIVGVSATGAWSGHDKAIAVYDSGSATWTFYVAKDGWLVWVDDEGKLYVFNANIWSQYAPGITSGTARRLWLPESVFAYNAKARSTPLDGGSYEYIDLPAAANTDLHTWWKVPDDFGALTAFDLYMVAMGTSSVNLTMNWTYIMAAADNALADNVGNITTLTLSVAPISSGRMVIKSGIALPSGPPTLTAGGLAKMYLRRYNAEDANPDDYRFLGMMMRYTTP